MTEVAERPVPRRRARPAADEHEDPMDVGAARPLSPTVDDTTQEVPPVQAPPRPSETRPGSYEAPASPTYPPSPLRHSSQATVTLNVRVSPDIADLVERVTTETGLSKRAAVERALINTYG